MPIIPGLSFEPKGKKALRAFSNNVFYPIKGNYNPNRKYMIHDNQFNSRPGPILKFFAQYDDRGECPRDRMKFRNCHIFFYVEDETIKVFEPHQLNTGFPQGYLISRNRIPTPEGSYYKLEDLNLGKTLTLYGKQFKILDCDPFTKNYLKEMGFQVGTPEYEVIDPVYADRQEMDMHRTTIHRPKKKQYKYAPFFKLHPKRLHFYVIHNMKPLQFQEIRYASLYYDLVDKTIQIVDKEKLFDYKNQLAIKNFDNYVILKPILVPKKRVPENPIGRNSSPVLLNLTATSKFRQLQELMGVRGGGVTNPMTSIVDSNPGVTATEDDEYYTAKDLDLGITLDIFSFQVYFYDCDEFTKEFYRNEFNRELIPAPVPEVKANNYHTLVCQGTVGNYEDTLQTCKGLSSRDTNIFEISKQAITKSPRFESPLKFYLNCRMGYESNILTFLSRVITTDVFLKDQYFVIKWYLKDDTIDIAGMNLNFTITGSPKGMFMTRRKLLKPSSGLENSGICYYQTKDMFVGNVVHAMTHAFLLTDADEYTFEYMENKPDIFVHANIKHVMSELFPLIRSKVCEIKSKFEMSDLQKSGYASYETFKSIIDDVIPQNMKHQFPEHQIKTLARHFAFEKYVGINLEHIISKIQMELKNRRFEDFDKLKILFRMFDLENTENKGHFKPARVYEILRSYPLSINRDLLKSFVFKFPQCNGLISFEEVVKSLNYLENPAKPPDHTPYAININWERVEKVKNLSKISYVDFLKELMNIECINCR